MNTAENNQNTENKKTGAPIGMVILTGVILVGFVALLVWGLGNAAQGTLKIGEKVPDFTLTTFDGGTIQTADLRGKVVLINIWASWCDPCANEAGYLEQAWRYYQDSGKVVFLGVDWNDVEPKALEYLERFDITYPNGPDLENRINRIFRNTGVPETFIIDTEGKLMHFISGEFTSAQDIIYLIDPLLK
jgi:cytochrome c biogenesis protein CcmG/thiol:disulfide interchange protein DsbE